MSKFTPRDVIAGLALVLCAGLLFKGHDGEIKALMGVIIGYYLVKSEIYLKNKKNNATNNPPSNI